jgi:O-acetyl-ADP-ribose deacetylase (regulator of RNase III)
MLGLRHFRHTAIDLFQGDITRFVCDAVVNAANERLVAGGGVDGAIHRAAGPSVLEECQRIGHCPTGQAVISGAGRLSAQKIIHAVGPVWEGGQANEPGLLASCHRKSLEIAMQNKLLHVAFPAISTGVYGYPVDAAAKVAITSVRDFLNEQSSDGCLRRVTFVLFDRDAYKAFQSALFSIFPDQEAP